MLILYVPLVIVFDDVVLVKQGRVVRYFANFSWTIELGECVGLKKPKKPKKTTKTHASVPPTSSCLLLQPLVGPIDQLSTQSIDPIGQ